MQLGFAVQYSKGTGMTGTKFFIHKGLRGRANFSLELQKTYDTKFIHVGIQTSKDDGKGKIRGNIKFSSTTRLAEEELTAETNIVYELISRIVKDVEH
ncbi:conserved hypothetical protein [Ricinus communis]|uniref:Uncharacterized protein n=1 Tax=Ricinus communis TaxID=3988 RepID=B9SCT9_RICCO|nr:conserved hypothetical protein [Ricinus communis]